jgi:hypothetical protein
MIKTINFHNEFASDTVHSTLRILIQAERTMRQVRAFSIDAALSGFARYAAVILTVLGWSSDVWAQWPEFADPLAPRDAEGNVRMEAPPPRMPDGTPDFSGLWMRANSGPPPAEGQGGAFAGRAPIDVAIEPFPFDPDGPPVAAFFEAGANMEGGPPYTPWAREVKNRRTELSGRDNPDALCLPMGFLQFHQQPQPRMIIQTEKMILVEYEANYGVRHIYLDGRELPPQGEPQPWWYGYSVGHWEDDDLIVETNNLRGAEDSAFDAWLDVNGSPHSREAKITERFRRPTFGHLQIDFTVDDPKAYTRPWTVRVDQRLLPDQELIEFVCNENQQFGRRIQLN